MPSSNDAPSVNGRKVSRGFFSLHRSSKVIPETVTRKQSIHSSSGRSSVSPERTPSNFVGYTPTASSTTSVASTDKRQSKLSLFDLFSKPKVERARGYREVGVDPPAMGPRPRTPAGSTPALKSFATSQVPSTVGSRPGSAGNDTIASIDQEHWNAPPLFQAYPQAIKHSAAQGVSASPEVLERAHEYRANPIIQDILGNGVKALPLISEDGDISTDGQSSKRFSTVTENLNMAEKQFVLTTSGRLLQYAGKGKYDRMPEKVLHLGSTSAAFACDLIPGKHWVLQIMSRASNDVVPVTKQSRSLFSRLRATSSRRNVSGLVMIFDGGEDMDLWLKAIRQTIEDNGGKSIKSDPLPGESERDRRLRAKPTLVKTPSHRFTITRDPRSPSRIGGRETPVISPILVRTETTVEKGPSEVSSPQLSLAPNTPVILSSPVERRSTKTLSIEASSVGTHSLTGEHAQLEQLREDSRRSTGSDFSELDTQPTSPSSSGPPSPLAESFVDLDKLEPPSPLASTPSADIHERSSWLGNRTSVLQSELAISPIEEEARSLMASADRGSLGAQNSSVTIFGPAESKQEIKGIKPDSSAIGLGLAAYHNIHMPPVPEEHDQDMPLRPTSTVGELPNFRLNAPRNPYTRTKPFARPLPVRTSLTKPLPHMPPIIDDASASSSSSTTPTECRLSSVIDQKPSPSPTVAQQPRRRVASATFSLIPNITPSPTTIQTPQQAQQQDLRRPMSVQAKSDRVSYITPTTPSGPIRQTARPSRNHSPEETRRRDAALRRESFSQYMASMQKARLAAASPPPPTSLGGASMGPGTSTGYNFQRASIIEAIGGGVCEAPPIPAMNPGRILLRTARNSALSTLELRSLPPPMPPPTCPLPAPPVAAG